MSLASFFPTETLKKQVTLILMTLKQIQNGRNTRCRFESENPD